MNSELLHNMKSARFRNNNAMVLRALNLLRIRYERLEDIKYALAQKITEQEYLDCINYLFESGYIQLRTIKTKQSTLLADAEYTELEGKLTHKGIKLLDGNVTDELVGVI